MEVHIGERMKRRRESLGLTQVDIGNACGVSFQTVSGWERQSGPPPAKYIPKLCEILKMRPEELLGMDPATLPPGAYPVTEMVLLPVIGQAQAGLPRIALDDELEMAPVEKELIAGTEESEAPVAISPAVAAILRQHLARQAEERLKMGSRYQDHGLVFCQIDGSPLWPSRITNYVFPHLCKKAGVRRIRLHDLRHTFITHILNAGLPATVAQRRARHTRWSTTVDMYGHITKDVEREGVTVTDDILPDQRTGTR